MGAEQQSAGVMIVTEDDEHGYLLYKIRLKDLFNSAAEPVVTEMGRLRAPTARFHTLPDKPERIDFALTGGGSTVIGVSNFRRTVLHDTASGATSAGPELRDNKPGGTFVLPLPGGRLVAIRRRGGLPGGMPFAEALVGGAWRALPDPPPEFCSLIPSMPGCNVKACVAVGARVLVSVVDRGTYSLEDDAWHKEGDWELPFSGRGLFVPELGSGLCFGLCHLTGRLCAWDITQLPPAVRYAWDDTTPRLPKGRAVMFPEGSLAYLGNGKFCIAWTIGHFSRGSTTIRRRTVYLMGVKVRKASRGRLHLIRHKDCIYKLTNAGMACALHADLD